ncbi:MAG TPA: thioredoxin domain-containing protein [Candidatus Absconditabacterales bacterium]|nr:thioredoxin domain-containing protein [Candidatus Absconditabacterales bacterium]HRU49978.1 thioredoxin domain-containing protein [Candidatus Absconditabacterales bacterium]
MSKKCNVGVIVLLLLILILNILTLFKKDARTIETLKVGGADNMKKVEQLYNSDEYISQQTMAIDQALSQINNVDTENTDTDEEISSSEDIIQKLEKITANGVDHGKESARFTILEYSNFGCGYCRRQSVQGVIDEVIKKYPNDVNSVFRNFGQYPQLGEAIECVGELKRNMRHKFIKQLFATDSGLDTDTILSIAGTLGVNKDSLAKCIDSGKYTQEVNDQTNEGRNLFGISGTPGNVIIDRETGKFVVIPGAYPVEKFVEEIEKLKNN